MKNKLFLKAKNFSSTPGVYFFIGKNNEILYIGRAVNLKKRILNYFQKNLDSRINEMVGLAKDIRYKKTKNLLEAIILEANLIKKYWPKYNVKDKDDRSFIYVVIPKSEYSQPFIIRGKELEKFSPITSNIFGPYQSLLLVKSALKIIRRIFPYGVCKPFSNKACFDYQIGLCPGLCIGAITKKDYQKNIRNLILFLSGERKKLLEKLKKENPDKIKAINHIQDVALIKSDEFIAKPPKHQLLNRIEAYDISHFSGKETVGAMAVLTNGELDKSQYRKFIIKKAGNNDLLALEEMILRRLNHKEWQMPNLILVDGGLPQVSYISKIFKDRNINIPIAGISKFGGDKLIFQKNIKKSIRNLIEISKNDLLKLRDESHRFAISFSRKKRQIK